MIEMKNVCFSYGDREVLKNFNLTVRDGQCVCLKGPSGCGKTTVLRLLLGLLTPDSGEIFGAEKPSVVFQEDRLLSGFSLKTNVLLPPLTEEQQSKAIDLLSRAGLGQVLNKKVRHLSGGMKRRAAIVRAVAFQGDLLVLDEPFNGIDLENKRLMAEMIKREFLDQGKPVLMVSHVDKDAELLNAEIFEFE
jgi:NitT/TauT family transport system ATP-binding protein